MIQSELFFLHNLMRNLRNGIFVVGGETLGIVMTVVCLSERRAKEVCENQCK